MNRIDASTARSRFGWPTLLAACLLLWLGTLPASAETAVTSPRACVECHDGSDEFPVLAITRSAHGVLADPRTPSANGECSACHGPSLEHARRGRRVKPDRIFGDSAGSAPVAEQNGACLSCHEGGRQLHWKGSPHENQEVGCSSCHALHSEHDPMLSQTTQVEVCLGCHKEKRAELLRPSTHPILDGQMGCSDCHNPHGSTGPALLLAGTLNDTCYGCHAEKRGPFLWEHPPAREDCSHCHRPHGSTQAALLKARGPWLCQQCHLGPQHPSTAYSGSGLPGASIPSGAQQMLGKGCMNCHAQVHGSNHPSGIGLTR